MNNSLFNNFRSNTNRVNKSKLLAPNILAPNILSLAFWISVLTISIPSTLIGFMEYDDEGLFVLLAQKISQGSTLYDNLAYQYGPLYFWLTGIYFKIFGISHLTSRFLTLSIILATTVLILKAGRLLLNDKELSYIPPFFWIIGIYPYIFESSHPGWFIAFFITAIAYLFIRIEKDLTSQSKGYFLIGILVAAIFSIKPHIGFLNFLAITLLIFSQSNIGLKERLITKILFIFSILILFKNFLVGAELNKNFIFTAIPFGLMIWIIIIYRDYKFDIKKESKTSYKTFLNFFLGFLALGVLIGAGSLYTYDIEKVFKHLFYYPGQQFTFFVGKSWNFNILAPIFSVPLIVAVYYICGKSKKAHVSNIHLLIILFIFAALAPFRPNHSAVLIAVVVFYLFYRSRKSSDLRTSISVQLIVIFAFNFFHLYPLDISHLCYVCPFLFLILSGIVLPRETKILRNKRVGILLCFVIATGVICLHKISDSRQPLGFSLNNTWIPDFKDPELQAEVFNALNYINNNSEPEDKLITLGCFHSLNVWANRDSPGDIIHVSYNYFPEVLQQSVINDLCKTKIAVLYKSSRRFIKEIDLENESRYQNQVFEVLTNYFVEVDGQTWNHDSPSHLNIMINDSPECYWIDNNQH